MTKNMLARSTAIGAALAMYASPLVGPAWADSHQTVPYSRAGAWQILVDRTVGNGCFAIGTFQAGTVVRVGWAPNAHRFYMVYTDVRWGRLEIGSNYTVRFIFDDGAATYSGTMKAVDFNGQAALMHVNVDPDFMIDFGKRGVLTVFNRDGGRMARLSLESSQQAIDEIVRCQQEMGVR
jgi:hypothetical protein